MLSVLLGGEVDVEERRPRTWNEPRRKRLNFVRDSSRSRRRDSDEWALVPHRGPSSQHHKRQSSQELWDLRKWEAEQRFLALEHQRLQQKGQRLQIEQQRYMLAHPPPRQQLQGWPDGRGQPPIPPGHGQGGHGRGQPPIPPEHGQGGHGRGPRIQPIEPARHGGGYFDKHDDYDGDSDESIIDIFKEGSRRSPKTIDRVRDEPYRSPARSKSRGREIKKPKKNKNKKSKKRSKSSVYSDSADSSESEQEFVAGFKAGIRAVSRNGNPAGRGRSRSRVHERHFSDDDSFDDLRYDRPRLRLRSKSRGGGRRL